MDLPSANDLFHHFFRPWYREDHAFEYPGVGPDMEEIELDPGAHIRVLQRLDPEGQGMVAEHIAGMTQAAGEDFSRLLGVEQALPRAWVSAFEAKFDAAGIVGLLQQSDPRQENNNYVILCCELGCALAARLRDEHSALQWIYDWPYWDSFLFDLNSMTRLNVFHWAVKRLSASWERASLEKKIDAAVVFMRT